jgi:hypothetical protein
LFIVSLFIFSSYLCSLVLYFRWGLPTVRMSMFFFVLFPGAFMYKFLLFNLFFFFYEKVAKHNCFLEDYRWIIVLSLATDLLPSFWLVFGKSYGFMDPVNFVFLITAFGAKMIRMDLIFGGKAPRLRMRTWINCLQNFQSYWKILEWTW